MQKNNHTPPKKISVIIPSFNEEFFLPKTLIALHQQNFNRADFEIIVVDNASTDQTSKVAKLYGADLVLTEPRQGTNQARQRGLEEAQGEIIAFLDADCIPPPEWLGKIYYALHKKDDTCVAIAGTYVFHSNPTDSLFLAQEVYRWIVMPAINTIFGRILGKGGVIIGGNFASFKKNFQQIDGLDTSFTFFGDDASIAKKFGEIGYVEFDPMLYVTSSTRRFEREGLFKTNWEYAKNYFKVMLKE